MNMEFIRFIIISALFFGTLFLYLKMKQPKTIWLGISFLISLFHLALITVILLLNAELDVIVIGLAFLFGVGLLIMPLLLVGTFLVNGVKIIRNEGLRFTNLLSLMLGIGLVIYLFLWPSIVDITQSHFLNSFYQVVGFTVIYLYFILISYTLTNFLNLFHFKQPTIDYFIVLGAGLRGREVTPLLAGRIDRGLGLRNKQGFGKIVLSGGQGPDEEISEGEAMTNYALTQGMPAEVLLTENQSRNTFENIKFSKQIIDEDWDGEHEPKIAIVTNNYHVLRGLMQARSLGVDCVGFGSKSKFYFSLNAFLREFVAYLEMTYKVHLSMIGLVALFFFGIYFITTFLIGTN